MTPILETPRLSVWARRKEVGCIPFTGPSVGGFSWTDYAPSRHLFETTNKTIHFFDNGTGQPPGTESPIQYYSTDNGATWSSQNILPAGELVANENELRSWAIDGDGNKFYMVYSVWRYYSSTGNYQTEVRIRQTNSDGLTWQSYSVMDTDTLSSQGEGNDYDVAILLLDNNRHYLWALADWANDGSTYTSRLNYGINGSKTELESFLVDTGGIIWYPRYSKLGLQYDIDGVVWASWYDHLGTTDPDQLLDYLDTAGSKLTARKIGETNSVIDTIDSGFRWSAFSTNQKKRDYDTILRPNGGIYLLWYNQLTTLGRLYDTSSGIYITVPGVISGQGLNLFNLGTPRLAYTTGTQIKAVPVSQASNADFHTTIFTGNGTSLVVYEKRATQGRGFHAITEAAYFRFCI